MRHPLLKRWIAFGEETYNNEVWKEFYESIGGDSVKEGETA